MVVLLGKVGITRRVFRLLSLHTSEVFACAVSAADEILAASADGGNKNKTEKKKKIVAPFLSLLYKHQLSKLVDAGKEIEYR